MPSVSHTKKKERLLLAVRIEKSNRESETCSHCLRHARRCLMDKALSQRCSECVRAKKSCDSSGYKDPNARRRPICRFFWGHFKKPPPAKPASPNPWFPAFELDAWLAFSSSDAFAELSALPDVALSPSFWADPVVVDETLPAIRDS